jgi:hypothetical protein
MEVIGLSGVEDQERKKGSAERGKLLARRPMFSFSSLVFPPRFSQSTSGALLRKSGWRCKYIQEIEELFGVLGIAPSIQG